jgi:acetolactate synthase-1/2/3 large subunit
VNAAEYALDVLESHGVRHVFGVPGKGLMGFLHALEGRRGRVDFVLSKHEQGGSYMADGYARARGGLGVCLAISGGAALNLMGGVASAYADSIPLLAITGNAPTSQFGRKAMMEFSGIHRFPDPARLFEPITKMSRMLRSAREVPETLERAIETAMSGRRGPVHLNIPPDVQMGEVGLDRAPAPASFDRRPVPDPARLAKAAALLAGARQPVILAGWGSVLSGARPEILALGEALGAPLVTTLKGKAAVPAGHPLWLGHVAMGGSPRAARVMTAPEVDLVLAVGTTLGEYTNFAWDPTFAPRARFIQVDLDPVEISTLYPGALALIGDARACLSGILRQLRPDEARARSRREAIETLVRDVGLYEQPAAIASAALPLRPPAVIHRLAALLPDGTQLALDAGNNTMFTVHYYPLKPRDGFYHAAGSAVMGWAVPGAIGVKLARPDAPVVCVSGDGGFLMNGMELETAASQGAAVLWVILTNRVLGTVRTYQQLFRKGDFLASSLGDIDLARVAAGLGVQGVRVEALDDLNQSVARFLEDPRPTLLDVRVDPDEIPPGIMSRMKH